MIWLSWRQFRIQGVIGAAGLVIVAIIALITGPHLVHVYNTTVATCKAQGDCQTATASFLAQDDFLKNGLTALLFVVPALIGIFWGTPLIARELETGTFRLAWTQSVTRTRWLAVKLGVLGLSSIIVAGLLSLIVTWWFRPIDRVNANQFVATVFEARNIAPIGYTVFAFALAVTAGALIRRTVPAMAATMVGFVAARLAFTHWIRPHLLAALHLAAPLSSASDIGFQAGQSSGAVTFIATNPHIPSAWTISSQIVDNAGRTATTQTLHAFLERVCPKIAGGAGGSSAFQVCVAHLSATFHLLVTYQPSSRYWTFQWLELAIFLAAALILAGICFWSVRGRLR